jgi:hypothetical protein
MSSNLEIINSDVFILRPYSEFDVRLKIDSQKVDKWKIMCYHRIRFLSWYSLLLLYFSIFCGKISMTKWVSNQAQRIH